jgi:ribosomal-protein-alanine N-acetyltransferase
MGPLQSLERVSISPATWRDFRDILALERACFEGDSWPWIDVMAALTFPDAVRLKAVARADLPGGAAAAANGRQAIGFVFGDRHRSQGLGWIASIGVHPDYQRRGIGSRLLAACERALGTPHVRLTLRPSNVSARRVYDAAGYVEISRLSRYYRDGEDGIVMEKLTR